MHGSAKQSHFQQCFDSNGNLLVHASCIQTELRIGTHRLARIRKRKNANPGRYESNHDLKRKRSNNSMNESVVKSFLQFVDANSAPKGRRQDYSGPMDKNLHLCMDNSRITKCNAVVRYMQEISHKKHVQLSYLVPGHTKFEPDRLLVELQENFELEMCSPSRV